MLKHKIRQSRKVDVGRRQFLRKFGTGAASAWAITALGVPSGWADEDGQRGRRPEHSEGDNFGRMFRLAPFAAATDTVRAALTELGKPGGLLDAKDDLAKGPILLITDLTLSNGNRNNPTHPAGSTFMGQFLDHDMTFDARTHHWSPYRAPPVAPTTCVPTFDLDSVYGKGPVASPQIFMTPSRPLLKLPGSKVVESFEDIKRRTRTRLRSSPLPSNDEHLIISGLQAAFYQIPQPCGGLHQEPPPGMGSKRELRRVSNISVGSPHGITSG